MKRTSRGCVVCALLALSAGVPREALAQNWFPPPQPSATSEAPPDAPSEFRLGASVYSGGTSSGAIGSGTFFAVDLAASVRVSPTLHVDLAMPFGYANVGYVTGTDSSGDRTYGHDSSLGIGNLYGGVRWHSDTATTHLWFGGGLTLPLSAVSDHGGQQLTGVSGMNGQWDAWLYYAHTLALVGRGGYRYRTERFEFDAEAALGVIAAIDDHRSGTDVVFQLGIAPALRWGTASALGLRLREVLIPTQHGDMSQLSATPFLRLGVGSSSWLEARVLMNLDKPLGFAFDRYGVWSFGLTYGTTF